MRLSPPARHLALGLAVLLGACAGDETAPSDAPDSGAADGPAPTDFTGPTDPDRYTLTMDRVEQFFAAGHHAADALRAMSPEERARFNEESFDVSPTDPGYAEAVREQIERHPEMRRAVGEAGLSPREYAVLSTTLTRAWVAHAMAAAQPDGGAGAPTMGASPENIAFVREHAADLEQRFQALGAEMEGLE